MDLISNFRTVLPYIFWCSLNLCVAQNNFLSYDSTYKKIQPFAMVQAWAVASLNHVAINENGMAEEVDDRLALYARRARFGFRGKPFKNLKYVLQLFYDNILRDTRIATRGSSNSSANLGVFDAFVTWKASTNDLLNVTVGFFRPQIGRESITSAWAVSSFEKAWVQFYQRQILVGRSNGRTTGLNVGGLTYNDRYAFNYNVGIFNTPTFTVNEWSPLIVARAAFTLGDTEMKNYKIGYQTNYYGKRNGLTVAVASAVQGTTDFFNSSRTHSVDLLFNKGNININGEYNFLFRERLDNSNYTAQTGYIRAGYNIKLFKIGLIEPQIMYSIFDSNEVEQAGPGTFLGRDYTIDYGVNWYLMQHKLKVNLHYVLQEGNGVNNVVNDLSGFRRGDYFGVGFNYII